MIRIQQTDRRTVHQRMISKQYIYIYIYMHAYLYTVHYATITNVKGVHHEHKNDGLKDCFAHVLEHEPHEQ